MKLSEWTNRGMSRDVEGCRGQPQRSLVAFFSDSSHGVVPCRSPRGSVEELCRRTHRPGARDVWSSELAPQRALDKDLSLTSRRIFSDSSKTFMLRTSLKWHFIFHDMPYLDWIPFNDRVHTAFLQGFVRNCPARWTWKSWLQTPKLLRHKVLVRHKFHMDLFESLHIFQRHSMVLVKSTCMMLVMLVMFVMLVMLHLFGVWFCRSWFMSSAPSWQHHHTQSPTRLAKWSKTSVIHLFYFIAT